MLYLAYGSNMNLQQMKFRCPSAVFKGTGYINDYTLSFRLSCTGYYASLDKMTNSSVPVAIFSLNVEDEKKLDRFEGYPKFYRKKNIFFYFNNKKKKKKRVKGFVYILPESNLEGIPSADYFQILDTAYSTFSFNKEGLNKAFSRAFQTGNTEVPTYRNTCSREQFVSYTITSEDIRKTGTKKSRYYDVETELKMKLSEEYEVQRYGDGYEIADTESGETLFIISLSENDDGVYVESIQDNDYTDYDSLEDALRVINNYNYSAVL